MTYKNMDHFKKVAALILSTIFALSPVVAIPVQAQWVDVVQATKEMGLDTVAWILINKTIERMSASTVNWINTGFRGKPAYVTDPESYYKDIADKVVGQHIFNNPNYRFLCGPIGAKIQLALQRNYIQDRNVWQCTLSDIRGNIEDFMGDFERGGWDNFFELTQRQQNNPIGAYMMAEGEMMRKLSTSANNAAQELNQGGGFMSYKRCKPGRERQVGGPTDTSCVATYNSCVREWAGSDAGMQQCSDALRLCDQQVNLEVGDCAESDKETVTPGSVINSKLNEALGSGSKKLEAADEINEIVSALLTQLLSKAIGSVGGLLGTSREDPSNNNQVFTNQLSTSPMGELTGYFCLDNETDPTDPFYDTNPNVCVHPDQPDTSVIDLEIPPLNTDPSSLFPPGTVITIPPGPSASCDPADPNCTPAQ